MTSLFTEMAAAITPRSLVTQVGKLELRVSQRVSTRKVKAISEELCGHSFSASAISEISKNLGTTNWDVSLGASSITAPRGSFGRCRVYPSGERNVQGGLQCH